MLDPFFDLLFPPKCPFCQKLLRDGKEGFCARCQEDLPWAPGSDGLGEAEFLSGCVSPLFYRENVREAVHRYKFSARSCYAGCFGELTAQAVRDAWSPLPFDAVTWAPLSRHRLRSRGYDQARLLAEAVAQALDLPLVPTLVKTRHTKAQSLQTDAGRRRSNVLGAYEVLKDAPVAGRSFLLVDDVITTGSTLSECARVLRSAGAERVYAATLARGQN